MRISVDPADSTAGFSGRIGWGGLLFCSIPISFPEAHSLQAQAAEATKVYALGGFVEILGFRWRETQHFIIPLLVLTLPRALGVMLLGVAAWRAELLTTRGKFRKPILLVSGAIGIVGSVLQIDLAATVPLAFAYAAAVLLWLPRLTAAYASISSLVFTTSPMWRGGLGCRSGRLLL